MGRSLLFVHPALPSALRHGSSHGSLLRDTHAVEVPPTIPSSPSPAPPVAAQEHRHSLLFRENRPTNEGSSQPRHSSSAPSDEQLSQLSLSPRNKFISSLPPHSSSGPSSSIQDASAPPTASGSPTTGIRHLSRFFDINRSETMSPLYTPRGFKKLIDFTGRIDRGNPYRPSANGGFADVYCRDLTTSRGSTKVAIKVIRYATGDEEPVLLKKKEKLVRELSVWHGLAHPNILPLYGITEDFGPLCSMVCPWAENGTLTFYLNKHPDMPMSQRLGLAYDVAAGLQYLHANEIVHGDVSGSNVLILPSGEACLTDFGLSIALTDMFGQPSFSRNGTLRWSDPVLWILAEGEEYAFRSSKTDIYSLGSIMLQTFSGKVPYAKRLDFQIPMAMINGEKPGCRADIRHIDDRVWDLVESCWLAERPTAQRMREMLWEELAADDPRRQSLAMGTTVYQP